MPAKNAVFLHLAAEKKTAFLADISFSFSAVRISLQLYDYRVRGTHKLFEPIDLRSEKAYLT